MTLDQTIAIWCIVVPMVIMIVGGGVGRLVPVWASGVVIGTSWWLAITVALTSRQGFQWWPEDAWQRGAWPLLGWALLMSAIAPVTTRSEQPSTDSENSQVPNQRWFSNQRWDSCRWVLGGTLACITAVIAMPTGDAWSDTLELHRPWMAAVILSCLWNSYAIESMARRGASRWCLLVALAGLGGPMVLAAATYGSLAEWTFAMVAATVAIAAIAATNWVPRAWVAGYAIVAAAAGITATARFYTYEEYGVWVYYIALLTPAAIATLDLLVSRRAAWIRISVSAAAAIVMVGAVAWRVLLS